MSSYTVFYLFCIFYRIGGGFRLFLVVFSIFGFFTFDLVYLFSVFNYAAQAEMCVYLLWDIARLIRENKYDHVDATIKVWNFNLI